MTAHEDKTRGHSHEIQVLSALVQTELTAGLTLYRNLAEEILDQSGICLAPGGTSPVSLEDHFFSALFLYSYIRGGLPEKRRILYSAMNQCLRGMVTGCDNLLDDEYKKTLDTDLPETATRFRSVLDIMVSDRVLVGILARGCQQGEFSIEQIIGADRTALHALVRSGVQEASEEKGAGDILPPQVILDSVHSVKTGLLFQSPWAIPEYLETVLPDTLGPLKKGLYCLGMGCQIMDDMVDLTMDIGMNRNNYVASLICHASGTTRGQLLNAAAETSGSQDSSDLLFRFPEAQNLAAEKALEFLDAGFSNLLAREHLSIQPYAIDFLKHRIGAWKFFQGISAGKCDPVS